MVSVMSDGHDHTHSEDLRTILSVTHEHLGVWIEKKEPIAFCIEIVEFARKHHFGIADEAWEADKPIFLNGEPTFEMVEDLGVVTDIALAYLNSLLPDGYYFDFENGLCLFAEDDD